MIKLTVEPTRKLSKSSDEKIYKGDKNISKITVVLPASIKEQSISEYQCELRIYISDNDYLSYPLDTSKQDNAVDIGSELTDEVRTLKIMLIFKKGDEIVGKTNLEEINVYDSPAGSEVDPSGKANLDDFIGGKLVTVTCNLEAIPDFAFSGKTDLEEVNIPNATYIGKYAFSSPAASASGSGSGGDSESSEESEGEDDLVFNNKKLKTVNMPNVTHIDRGAFQGDENLEISELPDSLMVINNHAFQDCPKVQLTSLPDELTYIGDMALDAQENLSFEDIPDTLIYLGGGLSYEKIHDYLSNFVNPETGKLDISNLPPKVFTLEMSDYVMQGYGKFEGFELPGSLSIPDGVTKLGDRLFKNAMNGVRNISLPSSVRAIGDYACEYCGSLTSIRSWHPNINEIGRAAFANCNNATEISYQGSLNKLGGYAFQNCRSATTIDFEMTQLIEIGESTFENCESLTTLKLPASLKRIGRCAFEECRQLATLNLPNGLLSIEPDAFYGCNSLTALTLPDGLVELGSQAFFNCYSLATLNLSSMLTKIPTAAFYGCSSLPSLVIPQGVTTIEAQAFWNCHNLNHLTIPNTVEYIGENAFYNLFYQSTDEGEETRNIVVDLTSFSSTDIVPELSMEAFARDEGSGEPNIEFLFADQETLNNFAAVSVWSDYSSYFTVTTE